MERDEKRRSKTREDGNYHTAQIGLGDRGRKKRKNWIGLNLDWIFLNSRNEPARLVMGTIFLVQHIEGTVSL